MSIRPVRWLTWTPVALVPFLGAWWFGSPNLEQGLQDSALAAAKAGGLDWARIEISGRDARIAGEAPDEAAITAAVQAVAGTYGIRRAMAAATVAPPPPPPPPPPPEPEPLIPPTVLSIVTNSAQPEISGTWPEKAAKTLTVTLADRAFNLGADPELTSDGAGNWKLKPAAPMADGNYEIGVEVSDGAGRKAASQSPGTLTIDTVAPPEPSVNAVTVMASPDKLTGTWPEGDAVSLKVAIGGAADELGKSNRLTSDGSGNWTLTLADKLPEGRHGVALEVADAAGNVRTKTVPAAIEIDTTPPATPTVIPYTGTSAPGKVSGRWAEGDAVSLAVTVGTNTHRLGNSAQLTSNGSGEWTLAFAEPLVPGNYDVAVETADRAGNISRADFPAAIKLELPPEAPTVDRLSGNDSTPRVSGTFDADRTKTLTVRLGSRVYELERDAALTSPEKGKWVLESEPLADGIYDVVVEAVDTSGNRVRDRGVADVEIDTKPPAPATVDKMSGNSRLPRVTGTWAEGDAVKLNIAIGGKTYESGANPALTIEPAGRWALTPEALMDGYYDVVAVSADRFGNESRDITVAEVVIDATPPAAPTVNKYLGNDPTPEITGTWPAGDAKAFSVRIGGKTYAPEVGGVFTANADGTWKLIVPDALPDGYYDVVVAAADAVENESKDASVAEVVIDTTAPAAPTVDKYAGNDSTPEIAGTWPDGDARSLNVKVGSKTYTPGTMLVVSGSSWKLVPEPLPDGYYDVVATAADAVGNESKDASVAEVVIDTTPPTAPTVNPGTSLPLTGTFSPGDTKSLTVRFAGSTYELGKSPELTAKDAVWTLASQGELGPGVYDVAITATDAFGNQSSDATTAEFLVSEPEPPPAPPPPPVSEMAAPTVDSQTATVSRPKVTGTWAEGTAQSLKVMLAGKEHVLGQSETLTTDGAGKWTLSLDKPLPDGTYDIVVETQDAAGAVKSDDSKDELTIDAVGSATPTVRLSATELSPASISGTWAEGDAVSLSVGLDGATATLATDPELRSDGKGNWTLRLERSLDPGSYDVVVTTKDARGRVSIDQTKFEILVKGVEEAQPVPEPAPVDCQSEFNTLLTVAGIRFGSDDASLHEASKPTIVKLATVAASCPDKSIEIAGHTDSTGSSEYNQALSERRAVAVLDAMMAAGVDRNRMIAKGYGEDRPLANNATEQGRTVNRRIEFKVLN